MLVEVKYFKQECIGRVYYALVLSLDAVTLSLGFDLYAVITSHCIPVTSAVQ
jgi:hypothetical protein